MTQTKAPHRNDPDLNAETRSSPDDNPNRHVYLFAGDLRQPEETLNVEEVYPVQLDAQHRPAVRFKEYGKPLVLNYTNQGVMVRVHGLEYSQWVGKPITVYKTETRLGDALVPCIRLRPPPGHDPSAPPPLPPFN